MKDFDLWAAVGNGCLKKAEALINEEATMTAATVEIIEKLVSIAISIDMLNLRWEEIQKRHRTGISQEADVDKIASLIVQAIHDTSQAKPKTF